MNKFFLLFFVFGLAISQNPSDRDYSFNPLPISPNRYFVENPSKSMALSDNKILVISENGKKLIKLDGNDRDVNFSIGLPTFLNVNDLNANLTDFAIQTDGKIVVSGNFEKYNGISKFDVLRVHPDGSVDNSFHRASLFTGYGILKVGIQPDGKILILGDNNSNNNNFRRLNSDGSLDTSFNIPINIRVKEYATQPDGKFVIIHNQSGSQYTKVSRLNADGTLDNTFVTPNFTADFQQSVSLNKLLIQSDNKIVVVGSFWKCNNILCNSFVRLNVDGSINQVTNNFGSASNFKDIVQQADGRLLIAGSTISRLNQDDLSIDNSFQINTSAFMNFNGVTSISLFNDQKILISGAVSITLRKEACYLAKINTDGTRDVSFNNFDPGFFDNSLQVLSVGPDGKIWVGGYFYLYNGIKQVALVRLNPDGTFDNMLYYAGLGGFETPNTSIITGVFAIAPLPDGKAYIGGRLDYFNGVSYPGVTLMRINPDGTRDTSFNSNYFGSTYCILPLPDGTVLVSGSNNGSGTITRLSATGSILSAPVSTAQSGKWMAIQADGKILQSYNSIFRTNADMTIDPTFANDSQMSFSDIRYFEIQADGKIIINGNFTVNGVGYSLLRLLSNGSIDPSFNFTLQSSNINVVDFSLLPDQKIIINYENISSSEYKLIRLNTDGSIDNSFTEQSLYCKVTPTNDGKILLHGMTKYQGNSARGLIRIMGDNYYFFEGQNKLDLNADGCDSNDNEFPNLKISINGSTNSFDFFANPTGNYKIGTIAGNYTIVPTFENPTYFNAMPTSVSASFPLQNSPIIQNFCITPNGIHNDLEIVMIPLDAARPGFDSNYKIVYKNKGNQIQSGLVSLTFNDANIDFVSASPSISSQSANTLNWNFNNLNPLENREIVVTLNVNSPTETPPVNSGDILNFNALISSSLTDEMPYDNSFNFPQTVVNSFDPNDKTCLEGSTILTTQIGQYVHYLIRFENNGTSVAKNIRVKDIIDLNKYDINTLIPFSGSHSFTTKISDGNKVEFYFENINLPFLNNANDGYIVFKIKTKSTLVAGDTFSNSAGIYFDYNSPITTNTATTVISALKNQDFKFNDYFIVYPNPVNDNLKISKKSEIEISSITIYDMLGQIVVVIPNAKNVESVDVSSLKSGSYFVQFNSDKGNTNTKFIKM